MGFHPLDIIVIVAIGLLLFGPKTLQSISHSAGRGMSHARDMKDKLMSELPMEDLAKMSETISQIPVTPQQAAQKLLVSSLKSEAEEKKEQEATEQPVQQQE